MFKKIQLCRRTEESGWNTQKEKTIDFVIVASLNLYLLGKVWSIGIIEYAVICPQCSLRRKRKKQQKTIIFFEQEKKTQLFLLNKVFPK